jgi:hypothetical protein
MKANQDSQDRLDNYTFVKNKKKTKKNKKQKTNNQCYPKEFSVNYKRLVSILFLTCPFLIVNLGGRRGIDRMVVDYLCNQCLLPLKL